MSTSSLSDWNSIDQYREAFPIYNCACLDILGYKHKAVDYFDQRFNLYGRINRALNKVTAMLALTSPLLDTTDLSIEIISDSIIMLQPANKGGLGPILLFACWFASLLSYEGLLIRGGISQGRHVRRKTEHGFDFLASEALQKAYLLESEKAVHPRVLIDRLLIDKIRTEEKALVIREENDFILHFAHFVINREGNNAHNVLAEMRELQAKKKSNRSIRIKKKYQWLLDYYYWTITCTPNMDAKAFSRFPSGKNHGFAKLV